MAPRLAVKTNVNKDCAMIASRTQADKLDSERAIILKISKITVLSNRFTENALKSQCMETAQRRFSRRSNNYDDDL
jgi:hypothetical protein